MKVLNNILNTIGAGLAITFIAVLIIACIFTVPALAIWALNTLFGLQIAFSFINLLAGAIIVAIISGGARVSSK